MAVAAAADGDHPFLPTRVLDLGDPSAPMDAEPTVRLHETGGLQRGRYATLSHCWGRSQHLRTLTSNRQGFMEKIVWAELPRTYADAARVTRALGIRYLWIDSLCIVQDDTSDWDAEAARMGGVYQQSYVTLAATAGEDGDAGLFVRAGHPGFVELVPGGLAKGAEGAGSGEGKGEREQQADEQAYCREPLEKRIFLRRQPRHAAFSHFDPSGPPLLTRAWVYQERVLSPRVVHFGAEELLWECAGCFACECGSVQGTGRPNGLVSKTVKQGRPENGKGGATQWCDARQNVPFRGNKHNVFHYGRGRGYSERTHTWNFRGVVSDYGRLALTKEQDRLPALAGVAAMHRDPGRGRYLAGVWEDTLWTDLQWETAAPAAELDTSDPAAQPGCHAPSWSWSAVAQPFYDLQVRPGGAGNHAPRLLEAVCATAGPDEFGRCEWAYLALHGFLREVRLQTRARKTRGGTLKDSFVAVVGETGELARVSLDFVPGWQVGKEELQEATKLLKQAMNRAKKKRREKVTGEKESKESEGKKSEEEEEEEDESEEKDDDIIDTVIIGESPDTYHCFFLTALGALLLRPIVPGATVFKRVGMFFNNFYESSSDGAEWKEKTIKLV